MSLRLAIAGTFALLTVGASHPAAADLETALKLCQEADGETRIDACTTVIQSDQVSPSVMARGHINRGLALLKTGRLEAAVDDAVRAFELDPGQRDAAYYIRGSALHTRGFLDGALEDLTQAIRLNPRWFTLYAKRATILEDKNDWAGAVADYTAAIDLEPSNAWLFTDRGFAFTQLGDYSRALADLDRAIRLSPALTQAFITRGETHHRMGNFARALADYDQALDLDPNRTTVHVRRGFSLASLGELDQAIASYDEAIRRDPENTFAHAYRGYAAFDSGDYRRAEQAFATVHDLKPSLDNAIRHYLSTARAGSPDTRFLSEALNHTDRWPGPVVHYFVGVFVEADVIAASHDADEGTRQKQLAEAHYYFGQAALLDNDDAKARGHFEEVVALAQPHAPILTSAQAELSRLSEGR